MAQRIHFRLSNDNNNTHALWTGAVTVDHKLSTPQARRVVAKHLRLERLPPNTLVVTQSELEAGRWDEASIRAATVATVASPEAKKVKSFEDVPDSFDQIQDMLKKFGLA